MTSRELICAVLFSLFAGAVVGFVFANMGPCDTTSPKCAQDWLSATSGWAAVVAAGFTVYFINKQVREGSRQHLEQMKFQAYEKLLLAEQVGGAASGALGTLSQVYHEFHDASVPKNREKMAHYKEAAEFALKYLMDSNFSENRRSISGNIPPNEAGAEVALEKFIEVTGLILKLPEDEIDKLDNQFCFSASSTHLKLAFEDLKRVIIELKEFRTSWGHLSV